MAESLVYMTLMSSFILVTSAIDQSGNKYWQSHRQLKGDPSLVKHTISTLEGIYVSFMSAVSSECAFHALYETAFLSFCNMPTGFCITGHATSGVVLLPDKRDKNETGAKVKPLHTQMQSSPVLFSKWKCLSFGMETIISAFSLTFCYFQLIFGHFWFSLFPYKETIHLNDIYSWILLSSMWERVQDVFL